jgi:hypothetical protein
LSVNRTSAVLFGVLCLVAGVRTFWMSAPIGHRLIEAGVPVWSVTFLTLSAAFALTIGLLLGIAGVMLYRGVVRKPLHDRRTQYLVTNRRVLIQRGLKEIHLERSNIVDAVDRKSVYGGRDVYLVMDGPQSRALAASGAFGPGENVSGFLPVLRGVEDADELRACLAARRVSVVPSRPAADA